MTLLISFHNYLLILLLMVLILNSLQWGMILNSKALQFVIMIVVLQVWHHKLIWSMNISHKWNRTWEVIKVLTRTNSGNLLTLRYIHLNKNVNFLSLRQPLISTRRLNQVLIRKLNPRQLLIIFLFLNNFQKPINLNRKQIWQMLTSSNIKHQRSVVKMLMLWIIIKRESSQCLKYSNNPKTQSKNSCVWFRRHLYQSLE